MEPDFFRAFTDEEKLMFYDHRIDQLHEQRRGLENDLHWSRRKSIEQVRREIAELNKDIETHERRRKSQFERMSLKNDSVPEKDRIGIQINGGKDIRIDGNRFSGVDVGVAASNVEGLQAHGNEFGREIGSRESPLSWYRDRNFLVTLIGVVIAAISLALYMKYL